MEELRERRLTDPLLPRFFFLTQNLKIVNWLRFGLGQFKVLLLSKTQNPVMNVLKCFKGIYWMLREENDKYVLFQQWMVFQRKQLCYRSWPCNFWLLSCLACHFLLRGFRSSSIIFHLFPLGPPPWVGNCPGLMFMTWLMLRASLSFPCHEEFLPQMLITSCGFIQELSEQSGFKTFHSLARGN